jgi:hypothetical protein
MIEKTKANGDDLTSALNTVRIDIETFVERLKSDTFARARNLEEMMMNKYDAQLT